MSGLCILLALSAAAAWKQQTLPFRLANSDGPRKYLPATVPGGMAVFDYDGDGRLDLFFANGGELPSGLKKSPLHHNRLLRNRGSLEFEDVTATAGLAGRGYDFGVGAADFDNDGRLDLAVAGLRGVTLWRNRGDGTFRDVTAAAGIDNRGRWSVGAVWFDMDNDGDQDLFVVNYVRWDPAKERECLVNGKPDFCHPRFYDPEPNALFRNEGKGVFTDVSASSGIASHAGKGMAAAAADFDGDGWTDLFVTNDRTFAFLFRNTGKGRFEESAFQWGAAVPQDGKPVSGMGLEAQDFDNDGRPDLVYTALRDETFPVHRNTGEEFAEATAATRMAVLSRSMSGWGVAVADLDNDGWKDIAVARSDALSPSGGRGAAAMEPPSWFRNTGAGKFEAGSGWQGLAPAMYRGLVAADLDDDGCLDVVLTALDSDARLVRNPCGQGNGWLKVNVEGQARVRVGAQWRHTGTAAGYASAYAGPLHFGLGGQERVTVEVLWRDGRSRRVESEAKRTIRVEP